MSWVIQLMQYVSRNLAISLLTIKGNNCHDTRGIRLPINEWNDFELLISVKHYFGYPSILNAVENIHRWKSCGNNMSIYTEVDFWGSGILISIGILMCLWQIYNGLRLVAVLARRWELWMNPQFGIHLVNLKSICHMRSYQIGNIKYTFLY